MKFKDYVREGHSVQYEERGKTTKVNGHAHDYFINRMSGDGGTGKAMGHVHKIKAMVVQPPVNYKDKHVHDLLEGK